MSSPQHSRSLVRTLMRRWVVAVAGAVVGIAVVVGTFALAPVTYTATSDVLLVPPKAPDASNPLLELGGLSDVPTTIARSVFTDQTVNTLAAHGVTTGYSITTDLTTSAPLLIATGSGDSPAQALSAMRQVSALIPTALSRLQNDQNVPTRSEISASVIHADTKATAVTRTRTRLLFLAALAALLLITVPAVAVDRFASRRATRRRDATIGSADAPAAPTATHPTTGDQATGTPGEAPSRTPARTPARVPAHMPAQTPAQTPAQMPVQTPVEAAAESPIETPVESPAQSPAESPAEKAPVGRHGEAAAGTSGDAPAETTAPIPAVRPAPMPVRRAARRPSQRTVSRPAPRPTQNAPHPGDSSASNHAATDASTNGYASNGHSSNGHASNGHSSDKHGSNGHGSAGEADRAPDTATSSDDRSDAGWPSSARRVTLQGMRRPG